MENFVIRIVDDDKEFLDAITFLLDTEGWETEGYTSGHEFLEKEKFDRPGCLILDYSMPELSGTELQEKINALNQPLPIIFLTGQAHIELVIKAFKAGACNFLQKPISKEALLAAVESSVETYKNKALEIQKKSYCFQYEQLTTREKQIYKQLTYLMSAKEISEALGISERTAEGHRASVMKKLGLKKLEDVLIFNRALIRERQQNLD